MMMMVVMMVMICRHASENLIFYLDANDYKKNLPGGSFLKAQANKIISRYVTDTANQQVGQRFTKIQQRFNEGSAKIRSLYQ
jgi:hypothetical protein